MGIGMQNGQNLMVFQEDIGNKGENEEQVGEKPREPCCHTRDRRERPGTEWRDKPVSWELNISG